MGNRKSFFSKKHRKVTMALFIVFILSIVIFTISPTALEKADISLGHSNVRNTSAYDVTDVIVAESGSIEEGNLQLTLNISSDEVIKIKMTAPSGATEIKDNIATVSNNVKIEEGQVQEQKLSLPLGASSYSQEHQVKDEEYEEKPDTAPVPASKVAVIGSSGSVKKNVAKLGESASVKTNRGSLFGSELQFNAPEYGIYVFELYGASDVLLDRISYMVKSVMNDEALSVSLTGTGPEFYLQDKQNVYVRYVPQLVGNKEILTIVVPPMYTIARAPDSAPGYVVSALGTMALPEELYDDAASDILKTFPQYTQVQYFTITFDGSISQGMSFSFDTSYNANKTADMGKIMLAYGDDVEKIPMRIGGFGKSADGSILTDKEAINGVAIIKNPQDLLFPHKNTAVYATQTYPGDVLTESLSREPLRVIAWHYPMTDVRLYYAYDPAKLTPKSTTPGEQVVIDGITYLKHTLSESEMVAFQNISSGQRYYFNYSGFDFLPSTSFKEGDIINFGPMLVDYTYKGVEYKLQNAGNTQPMVIKNYENMYGFTFYFKGTPGNWGTNALDRELEQGTSGEKFQFSFNNISGYNNNPTYVYEKAQVVFDFPYGVYPSGIYMPNLRKSVVESIDYYLVDNPTVPITEYPTINSGTYTFNLSPGQRISKISINYDAIHNSTRGTYTVYADIGTTKADGSQFDRVVDVSMSVSIKTKNDAKTMGVTSDDPVYKPFTYITNQNFQLVRYEKEDTLRFGSVHMNQSNITLYNNVESRVHGYLGAGFKKYSQLMKDYEDVVIEVMPHQGDGRLLSLVKGYHFSSLKPGIHVEKNEVYYKSNIKTAWTLAETVSGDYHFFDLNQTDGEYVTGVKVELGTLYGDALVANVAGTSSLDVEGYSHLNNAQQHMFSPVMFESKRAFFENSAEHENLPIADTNYKLEYRAYTSSEAQYINSVGTPHPTLNSNKARNNSTLFSFARQGFGFNNAIVQIAQTSQFQGGLFDVNFYLQGSVITRNPELEYYARVYLEVHKDFSIVNIPNTTLIDVKTASDSKNKVYIYEVYLGKNANSFSRNIKMFVHPDAAAPVSGIKPFVRAGISEDAFLESYMSTNDYFYEYPYTIYTPAGNGPYPEWGVQSDLFWKINFDYRQTINTQINSLTSVQIYPVVDGKIQEKEAVFREHEKDVLGIYGSMGNNSGGEIPYYEARFEIPKIDRKTRTPNADNPGVPKQLTNEYNMYVTGPVEINQNLVGLDVQYLTKDGTPVTVNSTTSQADLESIYDIIVKFEKLADRHNEIVVIPVATSFVKTGNDFKVYEAHVGAEARYASAPNAWGQYALSHALDYKYESYSTTIRVGQDTQEIGRYQVAITDQTIVKVQSFYNDGGVDKELETLNIGGKLQFNRDATHLIATVLKPDAFYITPGNYIVDENNDSDFIVTSSVGSPKIEGRVDLDWDDIEKNTANRYDLAVYALPKVTVADSLLVPAHTTLYVNAIIRRIHDGVNIPNPPLNFYVGTVGNNTNPAVATIVNSSNHRQASITGHKAGDTTYTFSFVNRFGDEFTVERPIKVTVIPNNVPVGTIGKLFDQTTNSVNLGNDKFDFELWSSKDVDDNAKMYKILGVDQNGTKSINQLERGEINFIKEVSKLGYTSLGFTVTERGNPVAVTYVKDGIYSFELPVAANHVIITALNKNSETTLTLKKGMDATTIAHDPNKAFVITITEKNQTIPVATATLKGGETQAVSGLTFGRTYVIEETPVADYLLAKVTVEKAGTTIGEQPTKPIPTDDNVYEFKLGVNHIGGEIVVYNQLARGKGIQLSKAVTLDNSLPVEDFTFKLAGATDTFYGKVDKAITVFPANVKWYDNAGFTGTEVDVSELKPGTYTLTEDAGTNYDLEKLQVTGGTASVGTTDKTLIFEVTPTSELMIVTANNSVKKAGWVSVTKVVDPSYLSDTMAFTLTNVATGKQYISQAVVTANNFIFSSWKLNGSLVSTMELPYGQYTLTETLEGDHYRFKEFDITGTPGITIDQTKKIATFTLSNTAPTINAKAVNELFERGELKINHVPNVDYGSIPIGSVIDVVKLTSNVYVEVENTLRLPATWSLTARSDSQTAIISGNTVTLPYQALQHSKDGVVFKSLSTQQTIMDQSEPKVGNLHKLDWTTSDTKGVTANVWFHPNTQAGAYSSTITWSLQRTP